MNALREFADGELVPGTRYRVARFIGSGGMGSVYEVEHEELGKRFVLKALLRSLASRDDLAHRLRNEWRALGRLEHPNIVSVTDAGTSSTGIPFYVMERLQGDTLSTRLKRERRLRPQEALSIAAEVLDGLSAAHRIGIVHRDVKPPNVFLVGGRSVKILDFGIAKMMDPKASQITGRGVAIGTPRYMSPEQASGGTVDERTDLYATGLILFEMIAGKGPFDGRDGNDLFLAQLAEDAPKLATLVPGVPAELDSWLSRLLAKKPEDRPTDAAAVAAAFRALKKRMTTPPPDSEPSRPDDRTEPGGPFDTLEGALTVPSDKPPRLRPRHPLNDATTRTGIGPGEAAEQSGKTLRLDALDVPDLREPSEAPTRTSAGSFPGPPMLGTPPPVEPSGGARSAPSSRRSRATTAVAAALLAGAVGAAFVVRGRAPVGAAAPSGPPAALAASAPAVLPPKAESAVVTPAAAVAEAAPAPSAAPKDQPEVVPVPPESVKSVVTPVASAQRIVPAPVRPVLRRAAPPLAASPAPAAKAAASPPTAAPRPPSGPQLPGSGL